MGHPGKVSVGRVTWSSTASARQPEENMEEKYGGVEEVSTVCGAGTRES